VKTRKQVENQKDLRVDSEVLRKTAQENFVRLCAHLPAMMEDGIVAKGR
jgi:hypothetical protein